MWTTAATTEEQSIEHYFVNGFSRFQAKCHICCLQLKIKSRFAFFFLLMTVKEMSPGF